MEDRAVRQPSRITFADLCCADDVCRKDRTTSGRVFIGGVRRLPFLHPTPSVLESIFQDAHNRRVKFPLGELIDKAPHSLTSRLLLPSRSQRRWLLYSLAACSSSSSLCDKAIWHR